MATYIADIYSQSLLCLPVYDLGMNLDIHARQLNTSKWAIVREDWATGLSACCLMLELSHTILTNLKADLITEFFWQSSGKKPSNTVYIYPNLHATQFCQFVPSTTLCQAHCGVITLISICHFHGAGEIWRIPIRIPPRYQKAAADKYFFEWQGLPLTRTKTKRPHSGEQLLCADSLNKRVPWWECYSQCK